LTEGRIGLSFQSIPVIWQRVSSAPRPWSAAGSKHPDWARRALHSWTLWTERWSAALGWNWPNEEEKMPWN